MPRLSTLRNALSVAVVLLTALVGVTASGAAALRSETVSSLDTIGTVAGNGTAGFSGEGGLATSAELSRPTAIVTDAKGNTVFSDSGNERVRVIAVLGGTFYGQAMVAGHIYTIAGTGSAGYTGDGGPAAAAELSNPTGLAFDSAGNLVVADALNNVVRAIAETSGTFYGRAMTAGDIYTIAGDGTRGYAGDGASATAAELNTPVGVALDTNANVVIVDSGNDRVRVVAATTGTFYGQTMTAGDIYTIAGTGTPGYMGDGGPAIAAELNQPTGLTRDGAGNLLVSDEGNNVIRVVATATGTSYGQAMTADDIYTIAGTGTAGYAGDGASATTAELNSPADIAVDSSGNVIVADRNNARVRVVAEASGMFYGQAMTAGDIYTVAGDGTSGYGGDGGSATSAELNSPTAVASVGKAVLISDWGNDRIRLVGPAKAPGAPPAPAASAGDTTAQVAWSPPQQSGGLAIIHYVITASPGSSSATVPGTVTTTVITGLADGTSYTFKVVAQNPVGSSPASASSPAVTPAPSSSFPGAPKIGTAAATGKSGSVKVTWTPPTSNGGSTITAYFVTSIPSGVTATAKGTVKQVVVPGLKNGQSYTFIVTALTAKGPGPSSAASNAATPT